MIIRSLLVGCWHYKAVKWDDNIIESLIIVYNVPLILIVRYFVDRGVSRFKVAGGSILPFECIFKDVFD